MGRADGSVRDDEAGGADGVRAVGRADEAPNVVVEPTVKVGALQTGLFALDDPGLSPWAARSSRAGGVVMLRPEVAEVSAGSEKALYAVDGQLHPRDR